ncbi:hypothetical protein Tco_1240159, partial [Tanacetum coccineum]
LKTWVSRVGDVMAAQPKFLARFKASSEAIYGTYGGVGVLNSESYCWILMKRVVLRRIIRVRCGWIHIHAKLAFKRVTLLDYDDEEELQPICFLMTSKSALVSLTMFTPVFRENLQSASIPWLTVYWYMVPALPPKVMIFFVLPSSIAHRLCLTNLPVVACYKINSFNDFCNLVVVTGSKDGQTREHALLAFTLGVKTDDFLL